MKESIIRELKNPPVVEAIVDVRSRPSIDWETSVVREIKEHLPEYGEMRDIQNHSWLFGVHKTSGDSVTQ